MLRLRVRASCASWPQAGDELLLHALLRIDGQLAHAILGRMLLLPEPYAGYDLLHVRQIERIQHTV
jgi:hypothetical protein